MHKQYFLAMMIFWLGFGLTCTFAPGLMDLFMTTEGVAVGTPYSDHVWMHGGLDILSVCVLLFALSKLPPSATSLRAAGVVGFLPAAAIVVSVATTPWWSPLFLGAALGCAAFGVLGFVLASKVHAPR